MYIPLEGNCNHVDEDVKVTHPVVDDDGDTTANSETVQDIAQSQEGMNIIVSVYYMNIFLFISSAGAKTRRLFYCLFSGKSVFTIR